MKQKTIWKEMLPYNAFWGIAGGIGFVKSGTLWGFSILAVSLLITAIVAHTVRRHEE